jgi:hypothetical protein
LAEGSNRLAARKRRIEPAPAPADEEPKGHESTLDNLARGPARRRGRPALPAEEGKRYPVGIRTTKALREALLSASRASGRSLAQEIEFRLERSFEVQGLEGFIRPLVTRLDTLQKALIPVGDRKKPSHLHDLHLDPAAVAWSGSTGQAEGTSESAQQAEDKMVEKLLGEVEELAHRFCWEAMGAVRSHTPDRRSEDC